MEPRRIAGYGWRRDSLDPRDHLYHELNTVLAAEALPKHVDLTPKMPPIWDQGQLGSCTGNGIVRVLVCAAMGQGEEFPTLSNDDAGFSRLFVYYGERVIEGTVESDSGAEIRTGIKVIASQGAPPESEWAYDIAKFADRPPNKAFADAVKHEALQYQRIKPGSPGAPMRSALSAGHPIVYGFSVPDYFQKGWGDPATTALPVPAPDANFVGGHCTVITGYDYTRRTFPHNDVFQIDNSWGTGWGCGGRFYMDSHWFDPKRRLTDDFWVVTLVK